MLDGQRRQVGVGGQVARRPERLEQSRSTSACRLVGCTTVTQGCASQLSTRSSASEVESGD
jgi:hypothetical protein